MNVLILDYKQTEKSAVFAREAAAVLTAAGCRVLTDGAFTGDTDFAVVLGGDGAMIRAAKSGVPCGVPVIGINLGRVGYLAELDPSQITRLADAVRGAGMIEERMLLSVTAPDGKTYEALNDVVIANERGARIAALSLACNGIAVGEYLADGLIFATPTGSTAYSMSAGGAAIDPALDCISVTPICSVLHRAKPMVFAPTSQFVLTNASDAAERVHLTVDGVTVCNLARGESVMVTKSQNVARILRLATGGFYEALRRKAEI